MLKRARPPLCLSMAVVLTGCGSSTEPGLPLPIGDYLLAQVNGMAPGAAIDSQESQSGTGWLRIPEGKIAIQSQTDAFFALTLQSLLFTPSSLDTTEKTVSFAVRAAFNRFGDTLIVRYSAPFVDVCAEFPLGPFPAIDLAMVTEEGIKLTRPALFGCLPALVLLFDRPSTAK